MDSGAIGAFQPLLVEWLGMTLTRAGLPGGMMVFSSKRGRWTQGFPWGMARMIFIPLIGFLLYRKNEERCLPA